MGFEQPAYIVLEEDGLVTLCTNLASPAIETSAEVTFQTSALPESAVRKFITGLST